MELLTKRGLVEAAVASCSASDSYSGVVRGVSEYREELILRWAVAARHVRSRRHATLVSVASSRLPMRGTAHFESMSS